MESIYKFKAVPVREVWGGDTFRIYATNVSSEYPNIKTNSYGNVTIMGDIPNLTLHKEYEVTATETTSKYGIGYLVINIRQNIPKTKEGTFNFLKEILTETQAQTICDTYPDILDIVRKGEESKVDLSKLKGIGEKTFSRIIVKIKENFVLSDLAEKFQGMLSLTILKKIYGMYTSTDKVVEALEQNAYKALTQIGGIGFKTADTLLLGIEKKSKENIKKGLEPIIKFSTDNLKISSQRCVACAEFILGQNENDGHTKMDVNELRSQLITTVGKDCAMYFDDVLLDSDIYYNRETCEIALDRTYTTERKIAETMKRYCAVKNEWNIDVSKYRDVSKDMSLTDEQMLMLDNVCKYNVNLFIGGGGCGKTAATKALITLLEDNDKSYTLLTPTGKSSKVLHEYTDRPASTIHRGLGYNPSLGWIYNRDNKLQTDIVIVDEFSMVDIWLFKHLLDAIDISQTKLLIIGDNAQLCSVGCGNLLHDFINSKVIPTVILTKIFRYNEGGLMKVATDVRFEKPYLNNDMHGKINSFGTNKDYVFIDMPSDSVQNNTVALYKKLLQNGCSPEEIQVLTAKNVGTCGSIELNALIQPIVNPNYGSKDNIKIGDSVYFKGDIIMQKVNNYKAEIYSDSYDEPQQTFIANGESGKIVNIKGDSIIIDFDGTLIRYTKGNMQNVQLAYAISVHKSQGSAFDTIILCTPRSHSFILNSNLLYVGLTRMKKRCYHLGDVDTVNRAVKKKINLSRNTFMIDLLVHDAQA